MSTMAMEIKRNKERGDKRVNGFSGAQRSLDNMGLEVGDTFTFPEEYEVYEQNLNGNKVQYIMVEMLDGPSKGMAKPFYPSTFTKTRRVYESDGTATTVRKHTMGTAAELYRTAASVAEGMDKLKGETVRVDIIEDVPTLRFGSNQMTTAQIPTINIVEKK